MHGRGKGLFHIIVIILLIIILYEISIFGKYTQSDFNNDVIQELRRINQKIRLIYRINGVPIDAHYIIENMTKKVYEKNPKTDTEETKMIEDMIECYKYHNTKKRIEKFIPVDFERGEWTINPVKGKSKLVRLQEAIARSYATTNYKDIYSEPPSPDFIAYFTKEFIETDKSPGYIFKLAEEKFKNTKVDRTNAGITNLNEKFTKSRMSKMMNDTYSKGKYSKFFPGWRL